MQTLFSTATVHPRDRFDCWHSVACKAIADHDADSTHRQGFHAEVQAGRCADMDLLQIDTGAIAVSHGARHIAHANPDEVMVMRQVTGTFAAEHNGREALLGAGDLTLLDPTLPYIGHFPADASFVMVKLPRARLEARIGKTRDVAGRPFTLRRPELRLTSAFLSMLPAHIEGLSATACEIVRDQVLDLLALALTAERDGGAGRNTPARSIVGMHVRAAIDARLTDPDLDTATVAAAAGVSVRYANAVLAEEGLSIRRLILARRLERCRKALEDPAQAHRTVSEIAYAWGFSDMTHFGRRFREAYGLVPSDYRRSAARPDEAPPPTAARPNSGS